MFKSSIYRPSCTDRAADGVGRGALIGLIFSMAAPVKRGAGSRSRQTAFLSVLRHSSMHMACFGSFLGMSSGMVCICERLRDGKKDALNFFVAGAVGGLALHPMMRNQVRLRTTCIFTGIVAALTQTGQ